jgi:hypothetical protein
VLQPDVVVVVVALAWLQGADVQLDDAEVLVASTWSSGIRAGQNVTGTRGRREGGRHGRASRGSVRVFDSRRKETMDVWFGAGVITVVLWDGSWPENPKGGRSSVWIGAVAQGEAAGRHGGAWTEPWTPLYRAQEKRTEGTHRGRKRRQTLMAMVIAAVSGRRVKAGRFWNRRGSD